MTFPLLPNSVIKDSHISLCMHVKTTANICCAVGETEAITFSKMP